MKHRAAKKTATGTGTDLVGIASAAGVKDARWANSPEEFADAVGAALRGNKMCFIGAKVSTERAEVPPYPVDEVENKYRFIRYVERTEKLAILKGNLPASYS